MNPASSTVRIGVIGFGQWGPNHVRNFGAINECEVVRVLEAAQASLTQGGRTIKIASA